MELLDRLNPSIRELNAAVDQQAARRPAVRRLMTHPGVGSLTALAFVLIVGTPQRFACGKQIASYVGLVPSEESGGGRRQGGKGTQFGVRLYWMWRKERDYEQVKEFGSHAGQTGNPLGVQ